jgi:acyl-CoA thioester hydrolase
MSRIYHYSQQVNFPDIDLGGGMYHGRYLDYLDRARQSILNEHGLSFGALLKSGIALVVVDASLKYLRPVFFEDQIHIYSRIVDRTSKSLTVEQITTKQAVGQDVLKDAPLSELPERINAATIKIVCVDLKTHRAMAFPDFLETIFSQRDHDEPQARPSA